MQSFKKKERLCDKKSIEELVKSQNSFFIHPFKVIWTVHPKQEDSPAKVLFAVPKRKIKLATKRNRIRRLAKEAYRKNKLDFYNFLRNKETTCLIMFIFLSTETKIKQQNIEQKIKQIFNRLKEEIKQDD